MNFNLRVRQLDVHMHFNQHDHVCIWLSYNDLETCYLETCSSGMSVHLVSK